MTIQNRITEKNAKPDFLDMDKDGDKKEPMKKAVADKKKSPVKEVTDQERISARKIQRDAQTTRHGTARKPGESMAAYLARADRLKKKNASKSVTERDIEPNFEINPKHKEIIMLGRKMESMSQNITSTDDASLMMANALGRLGPVLSRFGTGYVKNMNDVVKASALSPQIVQMLIKKAKAEPAAEAMAEGLGDMAHLAEQDHEVQMARAELYKIAKYAIKLHELLKGVSEAQGIEGWQQSKITKAADYIGSVYHAMEYDKLDQPNTPMMSTEAATNYKSTLAERMTQKKDSRKS
jgi:hypothetical protein